ncbi:hypothetical protein NBO_1172g0002 [Nosema bombycis CQ1]|uniref:Uncharacterized protein n=1 Tax=Nosema bombycis (strain CQ1 / CVCC 102059) TaxID=578461 RepID=R0KLG5_NOSB1|nr:hypothetical protein NBO_1172g0002 [Nosema bombycis CQ1]|eukprot:EOB11456.1 hypothetical protein NBO_1172g0002 [Nosema bombycis CQ1]
MKLFSLISNFLVLNNVSCSELEFEADSNQTKLILPYINPPNIHDKTSPSTINDKEHDVFENEHFHILKYFMKTVRWNFNEMKENEEAKYHKLLDFGKNFKETSLLSFKTNNRDDSWLYLDEISDLMDDLFPLFLNKNTYNGAIEPLKLIRDKVSQFENIGFLLPILIKSLEMSNNENFLKFYIVTEAIESMEERIKVLRRMFNDYWDLMNNNFKIFTYDLDYFELRHKFEVIRQALLNANDCDSDLVKSVEALKNEMLNFFTKFNEHIEEERELFSLIFNEMDCIFCDYIAFKYFKKQIILKNS